MSTPKATIIVPLLRQNDEWLEQSVRSALQQTTPCQIIVVTSPQTPASNLETLFRIGEDAPNLTVFQRRRPGFPAALNEGIREASTRRVGFLLSDDWLDPKAVEECLPSSADIVSTQKLTFTADGKEQIHRPWKLLTMEEYERRPTLELKASYLSHFFLFRKRTLIRIGGLDESLGDTPGIDDFDMIWTLLEHGASASIVEKPLYMCRDHFGERLTLHDPQEMTATMKKILAKHKVFGAEAEEMLARHARWFGKPIQVVMRERRREAMQAGAASKSL